jgi:hypothetical protein
MARVMGALTFTALLLALASPPLPALTQAAPDRIALPRAHRGKQVTITGELYLPQGTANGCAAR